MINITKCASKKIIEKMKKENLLGYGLRISIVGGGINGFEYTLSFSDHPSESDITFESNGIKIFVDPNSYLYLQNITIDFIERGKEAGFVFHNPKSISLIEKEFKKLN